MGDELKNAVVASVRDLNLRYPGNRNYQVTGEARIGAYSIFTVDFNGLGEDSYTNYCVVRGNQVIRSFYYLPDAMPFLDRGLSWRSLFIDQYGLVAGSAVLFIMLIGLLIILFETGGKSVPTELWLAIASATGYLFGAKGAIKKSDSKNE